MSIRRGGTGTPTHRCGQKDESLIDKDDISDENEDETGMDGIDDDSDGAGDKEEE